MSWGINQYQQVASSNATVASPHQLVQMLLDGALTRLAKAKVAMKSKRNAEKGEHISRFLAIIDGLRTSLDHQQGGELAANLDSLYAYMQQQATLANARNDPKRVDEVVRLLKEIKSGWEGIAPSQQATGGR
ncbi:flagellar export chaperone FliS [Alkalilimnicola ehrlichii]|uniref:Flagellar secretion chaperone FliS n=1 Tax=Alkalilimnicola ehrlichii TaxID=351052 RepID=A0A3E0WU82_9GAMM|nr:flagellar export chaperone FliS [Alkalilimnicola ehrlichii]RFA28547.1 flagellar export chaperone FliS [Alkalilimnicola ehrlichii]RFA35711.1 flagellar export chaperone FliS [Alkalilimnicola ehrlichii]